MNDNPQHSARPPLAAIRVSGNDRLDFLQGQFTQDLSLLAPDKPVLAGWTSAKGRLFFVSWLADWQDSVWFVLADAAAESVARRLGMFVLRADVRIEISDLPVHLLVNDTPEKSIVSNCFVNDNTVALRVNGGGWQIGGNADGAALNDWRLANIRAGWPVVWPETSEDFVPQMVNLDLLSGISFSKGCYVGQEIVARTQNLGRIKRRMYHFRADPGPVPVPGEVIKCDSHGAGKIVDAATTPDGTAIELLAVIRIESLGDALSLEDGRALRQAALPYSVPETIS